MLVIITEVEAPIGAGVRAGLISTQQDGGLGFFNGLPGHVSLLSSDLSYKDIWVLGLPQLGSHCKLKELLTWVIGWVEHAIIIKQVGA